MWRLWLWLRLRMGGCAWHRREQTLLLGGRWVQAQMQQMQRWVLLQMWGHL